MSKLGISIYPERSTLENDIAYIDLAHKYGFKRIFTSLLEITGETDDVVTSFKKTIEYANTKGMEVMVDINPKLFKQLNISYDDLSFFNDLGAYGVRLDMGFTGKEESIMSENPFGLKIEVNMSSGTDYINQILAFIPNKHNLFGSHNFYPMEYSGLSLEFFEHGCKQFRAANINTAAFVSSQHGELGPWPVQKGLPTLEEHRFIPIEVQVQHMKMTGLVDDVLIGNAYATEDELARVSRIWNLSLPELKVDFCETVSDLEKEIILKELHSYRGDVSDYLIRSSMSRFKYKEHDIPVNNCVNITAGDLVVCNNDYGQYRGEVHIALKEMENRGQSNVVGRISADMIPLIKYIKPWSRFTLVESNK